MAIDKTKLVAEWGAYYKNAGQSVKDLISAIYYEKDATIKACMTEVVTNNTVYDDATVVQNSYLQPWRKGVWGASGTTDFMPKRTELKRVVLNEDCMPDDLEDTWAGFLTSNTLSVDQYTPFVAWWINTQILPSLHENFETQEVFYGVHDATAATINVPKVIGKAINGLKKVRNEDIVSGRIVPIAIGAVPANDVDFVTYMENMIYANMEQKYWQTPMLANMSHELANLFQDGMEKKYGLYYKSDKPSLTIKRTNTIITPHISHAGSNIIWISPKTNVKFVRKRENLVNAVKADVVDFVKLRVFSNWWAGIHISDPRVFFTNDVELT